MDKLKEAMIKVLKDWGKQGMPEFDGMWYGYDSFQDALLVHMGEQTSIADLKKKMKELSTEGMVELNPVWNLDYKLCGRGWFLKDVYFD